MKMIFLNWGTPILILLMVGIILFSLNIGQNNGIINLNVYLCKVYKVISIANFNLFALESFDGQKNNSTAALKRWTPDNPTNDYPRSC